VVSWLEFLIHFVGTKIFCLFARASLSYKVNSKSVRKILGFRLKKNTALNSPKCLKKFKHKAWHFFKIKRTILKFLGILLTALGIILVLWFYEWFWTKNKVMISDAFCGHNVKNEILSLKQALWWIFLWQRNMVRLSYIGTD